MKLKFENFAGLSCLYVRGTIDPLRLKMLMVGIDTLVKDHDQPLVIHLGNLHIPKEIAPTVIMTLSTLKKKYKPAPGKEIHWVHSDRTVGDFKTIELFANRILTARSKLIGTRIQIDDEVYQLTEEMSQIQQEISTLGGTDESIDKILFENEILRSQKDVLDRVHKWQPARLHEQKPLPSTDEEIQTNLANAKKELDEVMKFEVSL